MYLITSLTSNIAQRLLFTLKPKFNFVVDDFSGTDSVVYESVESDVTKIKEMQKQEQEDTHHGFDNPTYMLKNKGDDFDVTGTINTPLSVPVIL